MKKPDSRSDVFNGNAIRSNAFNDLPGLGGFSFLEARKRYHGKGITEDRISLMQGAGSEDLRSMFQSDIPCDKRLIEVTESIAVMGTPLQGLAESRYTTEESVPDDMVGDIAREMASVLAPESPIDYPNTVIDTSLPVQAVLPEIAIQCNPARQLRFQYQP